MMKMMCDDENKTDESKLFVFLFYYYIMQTPTTSKTHTDT